MKKEKGRTTGQMWLRFFFLVYGAAMLWLLFGQRIGEGVSYLDYRGQLENNINLTPFVTLRLYWRILQNSTNAALLRHAVINLVGNVVMFVPLGIFLPGIFLKNANFFKVFFCVAGMIILVEIVQFFSLLGSLDVDDLILNLLGASVGYIFWRISKKSRKS